MASRDDAMGQFPEQTKFISPGDDGYNPSNDFNNNQIVLDPLLLTIAKSKIEDKTFTDILDMKLHSERIHDYLKMYKEGTEPRWHHPQFLSHIDVTTERQRLCYDQICNLNNSERKHWFKGMLKNFKSLDEKMNRQGILITQLSQAMEMSVDNHISNLKNMALYRELYDGVRAELEEKEAELGKHRNESDAEINKLKKQIEKLTLEKQELDRNLEGAVADVSVMAGAVKDCKVCCKAITERKKAADNLLLE